MSDKSAAESAETRTVKPLDQYDPSLVNAITKVNSIAEQANAEQTFLKTKTGDDAERIKSIADSHDSEKMNNLRAQREKLRKGIEELDAKLLEEATAEFNTNPNYKPLSDEDIAKKKANITTLRENHKQGLTAIQFVASMSLTQEEIDALVEDHVLQIERATRGLLSGNVPTSTTGGIKPRITNLKVNGTTLADDKGNSTFTLLSQKLKNYSLKFSGAELSQAAMDEYKVESWDALPDNDITFSIPAPTTDDKDNVIEIRFDKK